MQKKIKIQRWALLCKIIITGILVFLLWYGWDYTRSNNFPIKQVKIVSVYEHIDQKFLQNIIMSYANNGFFHLHAIGMKQKLLKLPWVYAISIRRKWPGIVIVNIVEQQAVLQWGTNALINHKGAIFTPPIDTFPKGLPIIFGPKEQEFEIFTLYHKMQHCLKSLDLTVKRLFFNPQHYWEVLLSNNTSVYLKESDPLDQLKLLVSLYQKIISGHTDQPKSIDLRYNTDGFAIKW